METKKSEQMDGDSSGSSSEDEEDFTWMTQQTQPQQDIPPEYWHMQKLIKYLKGSTPSTTALVLGCLNDYDLDSEFMQLSIREMNTLEVLVNLLETSDRDFRCKKLALSILARVTQHVVIQHEVTNLGIIPLLVKLLVDPARDLQRLAAAVIANVAKLKKSSKLVRTCGGIPVLVHLLDIKESILKKPKAQQTIDGAEEMEVALDAARALWSLSQSNRNKEYMQKAGIIGLLPKLLKAKDENIVVQTMGMLQNCGNLPKFQVAIQTLDLVEDIVRLFSSSNNMELKKLCAMAIFKHSEDEKIRKLVHIHHGLTPLIKLLQQDIILMDRDLLAAVTGAVWKLSFSVQNVLRFDQLNTIPRLVSLLSYDDETVLVHVVGALAECCKLEHNAAVLQRAGGIKPLVLLLNLTNQALLANTAHVLGQCAWDLKCMEEMEEHDAVRLIWSLLKNSSTKVQANAAWALVPCIQNATDSGEMVRSFVGGIELIVKLLQSPDTRVVACICAALAKVATDQENLAVVTDLGVVPILAKLVHTADNEFLQEHLASAIANCCNWGKNCFEFGRLEAVTPLMNFLYDGNDRVQATTIEALSQLSTDPFNCITLHQSQVVPLLIKAAGSSDRKKQQAAAKCLTNIRKLALAADKVKTKQTQQ
ncbi:hypothetical protein J6590_017358 [Homalodisca vitripennis]|nr:hypothetical protein J6590_017358 [Homalodisca vitripennis]